MSYRILICGGAGFVGCNLAIYFAESGHNVTVLDNLVRRGSELNLPGFKPRGIKFIHGDIRNREDITGNYDVILECSAQPSATAGYANPMFDFTNNTIGVMNVLEHARKTGAAVIFWSTNKVYSGNNINELPYVIDGKRFKWLGGDYGIPGYDPDYGISQEFTIDGGQHSIYGMTKAMSDLAVQEYHDAFGVKTIVNRFSCLAGARQWGKSEQGWVAWFIIAKRLNLPVKVCGWSGNQVRDVLFMDDISSLIDLEIDMLFNNPGPVSGQVFTIGGGEENSVSINEFLDKIGIKPESYEPERKGDHAIYISDYRKANCVLGWKPTVSIDNGIEKIDKWVADNIPTLVKLYA